MNFPFSYLFPDVAEGLRSLRRSLGTQPHFQFETIISPDERKIPLPMDIWTNEKTRLLTEGEGFIRDDYANYFKVVITNDGDGGCLYDESLVALYCGFKQPKKVILSYQILDNEFQMKVVDDVGEEVKYLGLQFPEDQHILRSVDPNCVIQSTFVNTATNESIEWVNRMSCDDGVPDGVPFGYNDVEDIPFDAGEVGMDIGGDFCTWSVKITKSMGKGRNVLHISKHIADVCFPLDQDSVVLVNQMTEQIYLCDVATSYPTGRRTRRIGRGWYAFAKDAKLQAGDIIVFTVTIAPEFLLANVIRCGPRNA